jgi:hypothetical protein
MRFSAQITPLGRLVLDDEPRWRAALLRWAGLRVSVDLAKPKRSDRANRYYFGRVVTTFQGIWSKGRVAIGLPPYTKEEAHSVIVQVCLGSVPGPVAGTVLPKPTRDMPSDVFADLTNKARKLAWDEYQIHIPEANEPEEGL